MRESIEQVQWANLVHSALDGGRGHEFSRAEGRSSEEYPWVLLTSTGGGLTMAFKVRAACISRFVIRQTDVRQCQNGAGSKELHDARRHTIKSRQGHFRDR